MTSLFCERCGTPLHPYARFCPSCGTVVPDATTQQPMAWPSLGQVGGPSNAPKAKKSHVGNVILMVIILVLFLIAIPLPIPFSQQVRSWTFRPTVTPIGAADSLVVSGSWSSPGGVQVGVEVLDKGGHAAYEANGTSGSFSLDMSGAPYAITVWSLVPTTVSVSGYQWNPLLNVGIP